MLDAAASEPLVFRMRSSAQMDKLGARFMSQRMWTVEENECKYTLPQVGIFNIEAQVIQKGGKVGADGLEPSTSRVWTAQTAKRE